jgi:RNA polymerase sigma-70 factor (ECF subfamily)
LKKTNFNSETDWIIALKDGNLQAFNELFDRYAKRLYHFSFGYLKSAEDAEEIVQEVFMKIWNNRMELLVQASIDSYIFTIAKNGILNTIRKLKSEQAYLNYIKINPGKNILLDDELNFNELEKAYNASIEQLSPRRREIYLLSKVHSFSNLEVSVKMNISVKTVENQMTSALAEIRKKMRSLGFCGIIFFDLFL